jgi:hypothetical protein
VSDRGKALSGSWRCWAQVGNATLRLSTDLKQLRTTIRGIALRVDAHRANINAMLNNATIVSTSLRKALTSLNRT